MRFYKWLGRLFLGMSVLCVIIGVFGIADGIHSVINGGYADNIVLGLIIATAFPLVGFMGYCVAKSMEKDYR